MRALDTPFRVAHIMGKMMAGGVESVVMNYYRHIDRKAVQFDFIVDGDSTIVPEEEIVRLGGRVYRIPPYQAAFSYAKALEALFRANQYPIVHSHINTLSAFSLRAAKRAGVPIRIAHSHSTAGRGEAAKNILKYALRPLSRRYPTHLAACSEHAGRWLFGNSACDAQKVTIIKNAIDIPRFSFSQEERDAIREELGIGEQAFVVGHVGRFTQQKNHKFLIEIFSRIRRYEPSALLLLIGEGELREKTKAFAKQKGLGDCVRFLGVRHDVHRLIQGFDVFLLPSLYEGLPLVSIEAQASGVRMVASDRVTQEARLTPFLDFLPLKADGEAWARHALNTMNYVRKDCGKALKNAGYDIEHAASLLLDYYQTCLSDLQKRTK